MKRNIQSSIVIEAHPKSIIDAFTHPERLNDWWGVSNSRIQLKPGGLYILIWLQTENGIKFLQTSKIALFNPRKKLHLEDVLYIAADKGIFGPFNIKIDVQSIDEEKSEVTIEQTGFEKSDTGSWYYKLMTDSWPQVLLFLKQYLES